MFSFLITTYSSSMSYCLLESEVHDGRKLTINYDPPTIYLENMFKPMFPESCKVVNGAYAWITNVAVL